MKKNSYPCEENKIPQLPSVYGKKEKDDARDKEIQHLNLELCKLKTGSCS